MGFGEKFLAGILLGRGREIGLLKAFLESGAVLVDLGQVEEALAEYDAVIARWGDTQNPILADYVALAKDERAGLDRGG